MFTFSVVLATKKSIASVMDEQRGEVGASKELSCEGVYFWNYEGWSSRYEAVVQHWLVCCDAIKGPSEMMEGFRFHKSCGGMMMFGSVMEDFPSWPHQPARMTLKPDRRNKLVPVPEVQRNFQEKKVESCSRPKKTH